MYGYGNPQQQPGQQPWQHGQQQQGYAQQPGNGYTQGQQFQAPPGPAQAYGQPQYPQAPPQQPAYGTAAAPAFGHPPPGHLQQQGYAGPGAPLPYTPPPHANPGMASAQPAHHPPPGGYQQPAALPTAAFPPVYLGAPLAVDPLQPYAAIPLSLPGYDPSRDVEAIKKATKGFGTDENALNRVLCLRSASQIQVLAQAYKSRYGKNLIDLLKKETSGYYETTLCAIAMGPLEHDAQILRDAIAGAGTKETLVTEILVGRHPNEMVLLRHAFGKRYNKSLDQEVLDDLSLKTKDAFAIILQGHWLDNGQVQQQLLETDLQALLPAFRLGFTNEMLISSIIFARSPPYLQALVPAFKQRNGKSLTNQIKQHFSGHLREALLFAVEGGKRDGMGIWRDAKRVEAAMAGAGTADVLLITRLVRARWDRNRFEQIKLAYQQKYKKPLVKRVQGETSGHYRDCLSTMISGH